MCGIFGYIGKELPNLSGFLLGGLTKLEYRGYDSAGIAILKDKNFKIYKKKGGIENLKRYLSGQKIKGSMGIGHTRWATHGGVTDKNAHLHFDCKKQLVVVTTV